MNIKGRDLNPPGPMVTEDGDGGEGWTLLTTTNDGYAARLVAGLLAEEGIETMFDSFDPSPGAWMKPAGNLGAPTKVYVKKSDLERASLVMIEVDMPLEADLPPRERKHIPGRTSMVILVVLVVAMLMVLEILDFAPCVLGWFCI